MANCSRWISSAALESLSRAVGIGVGVIGVLVVTGREFSFGIGGIVESHPFVAVLAAMAAVAVPIRLGARRLRRTEASLQTSEMRFGAMVESAVDAIVTIDAAGVIQEWNPAARGMFGFTKDEALGQSIDLIIPNRHRGAHQHGIAKYLQGGAPRLIGKVASVSGRRRDGSEFPLELSLSSWSIGDDYRFTAIIRDISERQRADARLSAVLAEREAIFQNIQVGVALLCHRTIMSCNRRFDDIFRYPGGAMSGKSTAMLYPSLDIFDDIGVRAYEVLAQGRTFNEEVMLRRGDGELFWGALTGCAIDPAHVQEGSIWIYADISERKRAQQELDAYKSDLECQVASRTRDLTQALEQARAADLAKDAFLASMSHDIRKPLTAIVGYTDLALSRVTDAVQKDYLERARGAGAGLQDMINGILDYSRIAAGTMTLTHKAFSPQQVLAQVMAVAGLPAGEKNLKLRHRIASAVPATLFGDPQRLGQVLMILVDNAIKYTMAGSISVSITVAGREADRLCLDCVVSDTGIGMDEAQLATLFHAFSPVDASIARRASGTGLGLSICKNLVEMQGGTVQVRSDPGIGSTFRVAIWLDIGGEASASLPRAAELGAPQSILSPLPGFDVATAVLRFGSVDKYRHWLDHFMRAQADAGPWLDAALAAGDTSACMKRLHVIKGQAGTLGITALHAAADCLEDDIAHSLAYERSRAGFATALTSALATIARALAPMSGRGDTP